MTLTEGLVVLAVLTTFAYMIFAKVHKKNPLLVRKFKVWLNPSDKEDKIEEVASEYSQQVYAEKRTIM